MNAKSTKISNAPSSIGMLKRGAPPATSPRDVNAKTTSPTNLPVWPLPCLNTPPNSPPLMTMVALSPAVVTSPVPNILSLPPGAAPDVPAKVSAANAPRAATTATVLNLVIVCSSSYSSRHTRARLPPKPDPPPSPPHRMLLLYRSFGEVAIEARAAYIPVRAAPLTQGANYLANGDRRAAGQSVNRTRSTLRAF